MLDFQTVSLHDNTRFVGAVRGTTGINSRSIDSVTHAQMITAHTAQTYRREANFTHELASRKLGIDLKYQDQDQEACMVGILLRLGNLTS